MVQVIPDGDGKWKVVDGEKHYGSYRSLRLAAYRAAQVRDSCKANNPFRKLQRLRNRGRKIS